MNKKQPKLKFEEDKERTATRSPSEKGKGGADAAQKETETRCRQSCRKSTTSTLWQSGDHPGRSSRYEQKPRNGMYVRRPFARSAAHREVDQYEDDNVGHAGSQRGTEKQKEMSCGYFQKPLFPQTQEESQDAQAKKSAAKTAKSSAHEPDSGTRCRRGQRHP